MKPLISKSPFLFGHVERLVNLPHPFTLRCWLGQHPEVRDQDNNLYLLADGGDHWLIYRRITPEAHGHARNALEYGPPLAFPK